MRLLNLLSNVIDKIRPADKNNIKSKYLSLPLPEHLTELEDNDDSLTLAFEKNGFVGEIRIETWHWRPGLTPDVVDQETLGFVFPADRPRLIPKNDDFQFFFRHALLFPDEKENAEKIVTHAVEIDGCAGYYSHVLVLPERTYGFAAALDLNPYHYLKFSAQYHRADRAESDDEDDAPQTTYHDIDAAGVLADEEKQAVTHILPWILGIFNSLSIHQNVIEKESKALIADLAVEDQAAQAASTKLARLRKKMVKRDYASQTHAERIVSFLCLIDPNGIDGAMKKMAENMPDFIEEAIENGVAMTNIPDAPIPEAQDWFEYIYELEDISCSYYGLMFQVRGAFNETDNDALCQNCAFVLGEMRGEIDWGGDRGDENFFKPLVKAQGVQGLLSIAARDLRKRGMTLWVHVNPSFEEGGAYNGWVTKTEDEAAMCALSRLLCDGTVQRYEDTNAYVA